MLGLIWLQWSRLGREVLAERPDFLWRVLVVCVEPSVGILGEWEVGCRGSSWSLFLCVPVTVGGMVVMSWWFDFGGGAVVTHTGMLPWW